MLKFLLPVLALAFSISIFGCAPRVTQSDINLNSGRIKPLTSTDFQLYELKDARPAGAVKVGLVKITDNGFSTNCSYDQVLELAKKKHP